MHRQAGPVGTEAEPGGVTEARHAAGSHHEMQAGGEQRGDRGLREDGEEGGTGDQRHDRRDAERDQAEHPQRARRPADRRGRAGRRAARGERASEQAVRPQHQDGGHQQEHQHQGGARGEGDAERLGQSDQQAREIGVGDAAEAAQHHHHEGFDDHGQIEMQVSGSVRQAQRAAQPGEPGAQREHRREQAPLVDAEGRRHLPVLGRGTQEHAPPRPPQQQPQGRQHQRAGGDQQQIVDGKALAGDRDGGAQPGRARQRQIARPPDGQGGILQHEQHAEGREQLEQGGCAIDAPQQDDLQQHAKQRDRQRRSEHAECERQRVAPEPGQDAPADIGAQHEQAAVREVHHARHAEDDGQPGGDEEQRRRRGESGQELDREKAQRFSRRRGAAS